MGVLLEGLKNAVIDCLSSLISLKYYEVENGKVKIRINECVVTGLYFIHLLKTELDSILVKLDNVLTKLENVKIKRVLPKASETIADQVYYRVLSIECSIYGLESDELKKKLSEALNLSFEKSSQYYNNYVCKISKDILIEVMERKYCDDVEEKKCCKLFIHKFFEHEIPEKEFMQILEDLINRSKLYQEIQNLETTIKQLIKDFEIKHHVKIEYDFKIRSIERRTDP